MKDTVIRVDLLEEKAKIQQQITTLSKDLEAVERLLEKYKNDEGKILHTDGPLFEPIKLSEAVKELIDDFPEKEWKSGEIVKYIQKQKNAGKIETNSSNIPVSVRSVIKGLVKNGYVEKKTVMGGMRYKKKL